jgi:hypothetical protein
MKPAIVGRRDGTQGATLGGVTAVDHRGRILEELRRSSRPLDDDQLSVCTGIQPRQQVNQICRALEQAGVIRRYRGSGQKIVNALLALDSGDPPAAIGLDLATRSSEPVGSHATAVRSVGHDLPPGSSGEQRDAERVMLDLLGRELGLTLEPAMITIPSGVRVEVDGCDPDRTVLVECWAHQGSPKAAQRNKVLADALKLSWISMTIYPRPRLILCLSDPLAANPFMPPARSWAAQAFQDLGVSISVVDLPEEVRQKVQAAQQRQYR